MACDPVCIALGVQECPFYTVLRILKSSGQKCRFLDRSVRYPYFWWHFFGDIDIWWRFIFGDTDFWCLKGIVTCTSGDENDWWQGLPGDKKTRFCHGYHLEGSRLLKSLTLEIDTYYPPPPPTFSSPFSCNPCSSTIMLLGREWKSGGGGGMRWGGGVCL